MKKSIALLPLTLFLLGCAAGGGGSGPSRSSNTLLAEEIAEFPSVTAYEAVEQARPRWLHIRSAPTTGSPMPTPPVVYLDGLRVGDLMELRRIRANVVEKMQFLSASDATNRFGTNHAGGAILVTTR